MTAMATVLEESRSNLLALPALVLAICLLAAGSVLARGIPADTPTRAATLIAVAGAVASVIWILRWRHIRVATLSIDRDAIVMTPRGRRPQLQTIVRRPDSRLHLTIASNGTASPTSMSWRVLHDGGKPRIPVDIYGVERVKHACIAHGWVFAD
jgi:hypothetical protein